MNISKNKINLEMNLILLNIMRTQFCKLCTLRLVYNSLGIVLDKYFFENVVF